MPPRREELRRLILEELEVWLTQTVLDQQRRRADPVAAGPGGAVSSRDRDAGIISVSIEQHARQRLSRVRAALKRLDIGAYGACTSCGRAIADARLDTVPDAPRCIVCELDHRNRPPVPGSG